MSAIIDEPAKRLYVGSKWPYSDRIYKAYIAAGGDVADGGAKETVPLRNWKTLLCSLPLWFVVAAAVQSM